MEDGLNHSCGNLDTIELTNISEMGLLGICFFTMFDFFVCLQGLCTFIDIIIKRIFYINTYICDSCFLRETFCHTERGIFQCFTINHAIIILSHNSRLAIYYSYRNQEL